MLKRGLTGTYISVEPFHLFRYIDEQMFRYNNRRDCNDRIRFENAYGPVFGKRLTYGDAHWSRLLPLSSGKGAASTNTSPCWVYPVCVLV